MSSKEFWEDDPQLYWSYRIFYLKKMEIEGKQQQEYLKYNSWLNGNLNYMATSISLNNAFSKQHKSYPEYNEVFKQQEEEGKKLTENEANNIAQKEFNSWARF